MKTIRLIVVVLSCLASVPPLWAQAENPGKTTSTPPKKKLQVLAAESGGGSAGKGTDGDDGLDHKPSPDAATVVQLPGDAGKKATLMLKGNPGASERDFEITVLECPQGDCRRSKVVAEHQGLGQPIPLYEGTFRIVYAKPIEQVKKPEGNSEFHFQMRRAEATMDHRFTLSPLIELHAGEAQVQELRAIRAPSSPDYVTVSVAYDLNDEAMYEQFAEKAFFYPLSSGFEFAQPYPQAFGSGPLIGILISEVQNFVAFPRRPLEIPPSAAGSNSPRRQGVNEFVSLTSVPAQDGATPL